MAHILAVLVFVMPDRVASPADHQIWLPPGLQHPGIAEDVKNVVGQVFRVVPPETGGRLGNRMGVDDIPQDREQVLTDCPKHLSINEGMRRRIDQFQFQPPG